MLYYFAYGSNLHHLRLVDRVATATLVETAQLSCFRLTFHKLSTDGSGKCNLVESSCEDDVVWGAVYSLAEADKAALDKAEGLGKGYRESLIKVSVNETQYSCFIYQAMPFHIDDALRPYHWYKGLVLAGARYLKLPENYIASIDGIESIEDPNPKRRNDMNNYLAQLHAYD